MTDGMIEFEDGSDESFRLTPMGALNAVRAVKFFREGYDHEEIADMIGLPPSDPDPEGWQRDVGVRVLVAMAEISGVLDLPEVIEWLEEGVWDDFNFEE